MANQTSVTITADTSRYERAMRDMQLTTRKTTQFISSAWIKAAGAIYSVGKAYEYAKIGAQAEQEMRSFENLAASYGANADLIVAKLREASAGTVDTMTLVSKAGTAMMMGISPDKISKLMEIARATSKMTGQTVTKAFEDISLAVGRQSRMILDNLGIIIRVEEANAAYAAALGITSDKLTDAQKKMAFMNATVEAGEDLMRRLGEQTMTTAEMFQNFEAVAKNAWTGVSKFLAGFARWGTMILSEMASAVNDFFADTLYYLSSIPEVLAKIPGAKAIGLDVIAKETRLLADYFKDSANWAHQFAVELWNINDAPIPMVNRAGGGHPPPVGTTLNRTKIR